MFQIMNSEKIQIKDHEKGFKSVIMKKIQIKDHENVLNQRPWKSFKSSIMKKIQIKNHEKV